VTEIDDLRQRLAAAERVCYLFGITGVRTETDREKATTQAWQEWSHTYGRLAPEVPDDEIERLAARRDIIRNRTLGRLRREGRERLEAECRVTVLEAIYERQHEPEVYAAHQWGQWCVVPGNPEFQMRDCGDQACRRVQTRHTPAGEPS
jgi:hypothetical protein